MRWQNVSILVICVLLTSCHTHRLHLQQLDATQVGYSTRNGVLLTDYIIYDTLWQPMPDTMPPVMEPVVTPPRIRHTRISSVTATRDTTTAATDTHIIYGDYMANDREPPANYNRLFVSAFVVVFIFIVLRLVSMVFHRYK